MDFLCAIATVYMVVLALRAVLSWFPIQRGGALASIASIVFELTEPVLAPLRRIIPPAGMFDLSFLVAFFLLVIVCNILCG